MTWLRRNVRFISTRLLLNLPLLQEQRVELLNKQLWFYKKYVNGIPLDYTKTGKELDGSSPEEVFDEIFNALCNKKTPDSDTFSVDAFKTSYDPGDDGKFGNDAFYDPSGHKIDMTKLNATDKLKSIWYRIL
jgi:hypothetical protein